MQNSTAAEEAAPQTDVVEFTAAELATFRRAKAFWQKSDWASARGVLLYTSCMTILTSHTLNANLTANSTAASIADSFFRQVKISGCLAGYAAMVSTGVFSLELLPFNMLSLDSFSIIKQIELVQFSCKNRRLYGSMGRHCSLATVMLLIISQLFGCFGSHTGFDMLDFDTTGLGWQVIMAVTYLVEAVAAVVIAKESDDVSASSDNSDSSGHLLPAEKLATPLFDKVKTSNSIFWWHQICFCLLFLALFNLQLLRKIYLGPGHPVSKASSALNL